MPDEAWWHDLSESERETVRLLARLEQHTLLRKLGDALADVTHVVHEMNAPGEIAVKIKISQPAAHEPMTAIVVSISKKVPGHKPVGQFAFYQDGQFSERDQRQPELPAGRSVERGVDARSIAERRAAIRKVGNDDD